MEYYQVLPDTIKYDWMLQNICKYYWITLDVIHYCWRQSSIGLRPTPPPRTGSIIVFAQVRANLFRCGRSCHSSLLQPVPWTSSLNVFLWFRFVFFANRLPHLFPNRFKSMYVNVLLEVIQELHGEPLVPKMRPGVEPNIELDFPPPVWGAFWNIFWRNLEKQLVFVLCLEAATWAVFYRFLPNFVFVFWGLVGAFGKY